MIYRMPLFVSLCLVMTLATRTARSQENNDAAAREQLGKAIDYFQGGKYHEAMLLFERLNADYTLNPRYMAYLGECYFYEWQYDKAANILDSVIPLLHVLSPQERAVYLFADAESHFNQQEYIEALKMYNAMIPLCRANERGDALFSMGMIQLRWHNYPIAFLYLYGALSNYEQFHNVGQRARIIQLKHMTQALAQSLLHKIKTSLDSSPNNKYIKEDVDIISSAEKR